jgi:hypothetical protein
MPTPVQASTAGDNAADNAEAFGIPQTEYSCGTRDDLITDVFKSDNNAKDLDCR